MIEMVPSQLVLSTMVVWCHSENVIQRLYLFFNFCIFLHAWVIYSLELKNYNKKVQVFYKWESTYSIQRIIIYICITVAH